MMRTTKGEKTTPAFIPAEDGAAYPLFDLSGKTRREDHLRKQLDDLKKEFQEELTLRIRNVLGTSSPRASVSKWNESLPEEACFWLSSTTGIHQTLEHPVLALDKKTLLSFSELFFDGNPDSLTDAQIDNAKVTGTDDRQLARIYQSFTKFVGDDLGFDTSSWSRKWLEHAPEYELLWNKVTVKSPNWSFDFYLGWPVAMSYEEETQRSGPVDGMALASELVDVPVTLRLDMGQVDINLDTLNRMKVGDILPLDLFTTVTAKAGDSECLQGHVCDLEGQLCLRITQNMGMS